MNTSLKIPFLSVFLILTILGCSDKKTKHIPENPYLKQLTEKQIGETNYYISIPKKYTIKENRGPDFSVYYFYPADTTAIAAFSGGFYFGNHPSFFEPSDSCKTEKMQRKILNKNTDWTVYNCKGKYSIQSIVESGSNEGWNQYIHTFAGANSVADLKKVFLILETMKKKEPSKQPK
ncbi:hypothetical protein SAMN05444671_4647 [Flavobacterium sp. CF108]|uniref:hypothetical protein n=1 Tax=unclassified Flavobacterium TaxID=196869 RepID=UPI0008B44DFB|nr:MULTISPECIES: hypothetical protein [unclassified Flavobacterium]SEP22895.1 hypothetical protein SAMN04487978_0135 [Flavobacterium sp. fv08]SHI00256.1 hypothetical protein SAMN05444671_4647 [Flavobacterium sp. CF108]